LCVSAYHQAAPARSHQEIDVAVLYSAERSNLTSASAFWSQGGALELSAEAFNGLGIAMDIAGLRASNIKGTGVNLSTLTATFGPRYTCRRDPHKLAIFGQGLIGESHGLIAYSRQLPEL